MGWKSGLGIEVARGITAHLAASTPYFRIVGGNIALTGLIGEITTAPGGACNATWVFRPTTGTPTNICALLALAACVAGDILTIDGVAANAMLASNVPCAPMFGGPQANVLGIGDMELLLSTNVGQSRWWIWYIPVDAGAYVIWV
jgi:hypothetical protein